MRTSTRFLLAALVWGMALINAHAQTAGCPVRPGGGSTVGDPIILQSQNGVLRLDLTIRNSVAIDGSNSFCYVYADGSEAPTLMVNPGDLLVFRLTNRLGPLGAFPPKQMAQMSHMAGVTISPATDPCAGGNMTVSSTNVHFHGLNIPPKCHQDEVIKTTVQPGDPPFQYSIRIPANEPPGLYWYHPHPHGFTATQIVGGAAGALIVAGIEKVRPEVAGLPQRVLVLRQKALPGTSGDDSSIISVNFVPAFEKFSPIIDMKPGERQFWRVVNASSISFMQLQFWINGLPETMQLVAVDGVPLPAVADTDTVTIPPAGRAELIVTGPAASELGQFVDLGFDTGPGGDPNPTSLLGTIFNGSSAKTPPAHVPLFTKAAQLKRFTGLSALTANKQRKLYFSESPDGLTFFITVAGQTPKVYDPYDPPAITTRQGAVEDWIIENRSTEVHAFHIHQIHFMVLETNGNATNDATIRDTIVVPYWDGVSPTYPSVKLRMDFRDPETVGTFLYHCHILDHEDGGMMAKIRVNPAN